MKELKSVWQKTEHIEYDELIKDIECEILVVGGGISGILCAHALSERGHEVVLVEATRIMSGVTKNTTATITSQHGLIYKDIAKKYGLNSAKLFYESQEEGIDLYESLIARHNIDCDFQRLDGYFYARNTDTTELLDEYETLRQLGANVSYIKKLEHIDLDIIGGIKQERQGQFDPLRFLSGLPKNFKIYENSRIKDLHFDTQTAFTDNAKISANKIIIATHYPIVDIPGFTFAKQYQSMSYASAFINAGNIKGIYNDNKEDGITLRNYNDMLIVNGLDHRTGRKETQDCFDKLAKVAKSLYPNSEKVCSWLTEDCATYDNIPLVGRIKKDNVDNFIITGFNKWGMANSIISAGIISDIIDKVPNKYIDLFSPQRKYIFRNMGDFLKGMGISIANLSKSFLTFPLKCLNKLEQGNGDVFLIKGKKCAAYKDMQDNIHIIPARCPHLGCQLTFNKEALSWDCPCHGSRYDIYGNIITEPTVDANVYSLDKDSSGT